MEIDWGLPIEWDDGTEARYAPELDFTPSARLRYVQLTGGMPAKWDSHLYERKCVYVNENTGRVHSHERRCNFIRNIGHEKAMAQLQEAMADNQAWGMF